MLAPTQRGLSVIYVAGSARELPAEVQDWLAQSHVRAVASPHIYDMLAQLARGKRFEIIIVSIEAVDWNELEFFDQAARLSRETRIHVVGHAQHRAKLDAACKHGALLLDLPALEEELAPPVVQFGRLTRPAVEPAPIAEPPAAAEPGPATEPSFFVQPPVAAEPRPGAAPVIRPVVPKPRRVFPETAPVAARPPTRTGSDVDRLVAAWTEPIQPEPPAADVLADRILVQQQPAALEAAASVEVPSSPLPAIAREATEEDHDGQECKVIPFPWSPGPDRPKRTPPRSAPDATVADGNRENAPTGARRPVGSTNPPPVRLTAEELAALLGSPDRSDARDQETQS